MCDFSLDACSLCNCINSWVCNCQTNKTPDDEPATVTATLGRRVIYIDLIDDWNQPQTTILAASAAGFNIINLAFYLSATGPTDAAVAWQGLTDSVKLSTIQTVHNAGGRVLVSLGGATDFPYDQDPTELGKRVAQWAVDQHLDGVDFDLEAIQPGFVVPGALPTAAQLLQWLKSLTDAARGVLGTSRLISHAPQAPYLGVPNTPGTWPGTTGGYTAAFLAGNIDFLNIQFYNQGGGCYQDYNGIFVAACTNFPTSAISQLSQQGTLPLNALVLGMPVAPNDAGQPFPDATTIHSIVTQANTQLGWTAGIMGWQWHAGGSAGTWLSTILTGSSS